MARSSKKSKQISDDEHLAPGVPAALDVGRQLGGVARRLREGQGLTLTDVATAAGISAGMLRVNVPPKLRRRKFWLEKRQMSASLSIRLRFSFV